MVGFAHFETDCPQTEHTARSWIALQEAKRRGLTVEHLHVLGRPSTEYRVHFGSRRFYFDLIPTRVLHDALDDKAFVKKTLATSNFPVAEGRVFWNKKRAARYGRTLGFPLAVKPAHGTRSQHVTAPVNSPEELHMAIGIARAYGGRFIVERYIDGELYRVTVINRTDVFVTQRLAPQIVGDGRHTIAELIAMKNTDPRRGGTHDRHATLHRITVNPTFESLLADQGMTTTSIPDPDAVVLLSKKRSSGSGGDLIEQTAELHPETREMFRRAAALFGVDVVGFDFIAQDIRIPYRQQHCGILEANSLPFIDFHVNASEGPMQPIAERLWDSVIADSRVGSIRPRVTTHDRPFRVMALMIPVVVGRVLIYLNLADNERQPFLLGRIHSTASPERVIAHLKERGFEAMPLAWDDAGQVASIRKLLSHELQCHVRIFADRQVRAHIEYAPEARPWAHLFEHGLRHPDGLLQSDLDGLLEDYRLPNA